MGGKKMKLLARCADNLSSYQREASFSKEANFCNLFCMSNQVILLVFVSNRELEENYQEINGEEGGKL